MTVAVLVLICVVLGAGGYFLHEWSNRRIKNPPPERDLRDLADPGRWPDPPPSNGSERDPGTPSDGGVA